MNINNMYNNEDDEDEDTDRSNIDNILHRKNIFLADLRHNQPLKAGELKKFLERVKKEDELAKDYQESPIYQLGFDDGWKRGYDEGYTKLYAILKAVSVLIEPNLKN